MDSQNEITLHDDKGLSPEGLLKDSCVIIEQAQLSAYQAVNETLIKRNWLLGMRIQHEVLKEQRAEYGEQVIKKLAADLIKRYGRGFSKSNLYLFVSFYVSHPDFFQSLTGKSPIRLSWTHYSITIQVEDDEARLWYENETVNEMWSTRTLQRTENWSQFATLNEKRGQHLK